MLVFSPSVVRPTIFVFYAASAYESRQHPVSTTHVTVALAQFYSHAVVTVKQPDSC